MAAECLLLLEDGTGFLVFEDGSGDLLLESCVSTECGYELEDSGGVILLESGDVLLRENCGVQPTPIVGGWIEPWPLMDDDEDELVTITLLLSRRRRLVVG